MSRTMGLSSTSSLFSLFELGTRIKVWFEILIFKDRLRQQQPDVRLLLNTKHYQNLQQHQIKPEILKALYLFPKITLDYHLWSHVVLCSAVNEQFLEKSQVGQPWSSLGQALSERQILVAELQSH